MTTSDLGRIGAYWAVLDVAHDVADHVVQTDVQASEKAATDGWVGPMIGHVGTYQATQAAALAAYWAATRRRPPWWVIGAAAALSAGTHAFLDRRWPVAGLLRATASERFADPRFVVHTSTHEVIRHAARSSDANLDLALHKVPLHGVYLADQSLHRLALLACAALLAWGDGR